MYDFEWHATHRNKTEYSAIKVISIIIDIFHPNSVLDVGCGDGIWLDACKRLGFSITRGLDGPWTKLELLKIPRNEVHICDLSCRFDLDDRYDLSMSLEVAEHIPHNSSDIFVDNMVAHSDLIVFGAAIPYQGGFRHKNEQWQSFWAEKFSDRGYVAFDVIRPQIWNDNNIWFWYRQNMIVYIKSSRNDLVDSVNSYIQMKRLSMYPLDLIHPEKYLAAASYDQIAFKPLLKKLPSRLFRKANSFLRGKA